jgi:large subunit ribosomal protein L32
MASVKKPMVTSCPRCQAPKASHRVCMKCGYYRDEQIVEVAQETE